MLKKSFNHLIDSNLPKDDLEKLQSIIRTSVQNPYRCHNLKTRRSGQNTIVEITLFSPKDATVEQADSAANKLKNSIEQMGKRIQTTIIIKPNEE